MNFLVICGTPKEEGLCCSVIDKIVCGAKDGGADTVILNPNELGRCRMCSGGWGTCRKEHVCAYGDDGFNDAQHAVKQADAICIISPVYWSEMAEGLKCFLDKLRRCENRLSEYEGALSGKSVLLVASPGGSGNGMLECLTQMDRFCRHTNANIFDYIGVNRWNSDYKKEAAYKAAKAMCQGRQPGDTV